MAFTQIMAKSANYDEIDVEAKTNVGSDEKQIITKINSDLIHHTHIDTFVI